MLKGLSALLEKLTGPGADEGLGQGDLRVASAALLVHATAIDGLVTEAESEQIQALLASHFELPPEEVNRLRVAAEREEREAIDIYRFTSVLRDRLAPGQKRDLVAMMWRLVYADGHLEALEDNLVWRTAELLAVPARERMQLKQMIRAEQEIR